MDPPAYMPPAASVIQDSPRRSIQDLRAQIIANGSIIKPESTTDRPSDDHIEVILAKTPASSRPQQTSSNTHWTEKQILEMNGKSGSKRRPLVIPTPATLSTDGTASSSSASSGKHYAVLVKRNGSSSTVRIILKGELSDTPEEALEWMLERTEMMMHDAVVKYGKPADEGCSVM